MEDSAPFYAMTVPVFDFSALGMSIPRIGTIVFTMDMTYINAQIAIGNLLYGASTALYDDLGHIMSGISVNGEPTIMSFFPSTGWRLDSHLKEGVITVHLQPLMLIIVGISFGVMAFVMILSVLIYARMNKITQARNNLEILAYRSQINPHFLYNTFECIGGMALSRDAHEVAEMSGALSQMFNYAVKEADFVSVQEELDHIAHYALIIGYRFMGRIKITVDAAPEAAGLRIPRLVLQPVVENAVFHGLEPKKGCASSM